MTLETFYFIAQIVAALAVVASLIFVGIQVHGNTREQRNSRNRDWAQRVAPYWSDFFNNKELCLATMKANQGAALEELTPYEQFLISMNLMRLMDSFLMTYRQAQEGVDDPIVREQVLSRIRGLIMLVPLNRQLWRDQLRGRFEPGFRGFVDEIVAAVEAENESLGL